ncbi:MAG: tetratricopeptide repeat protein, partial [Spirochaetaceae bacterium]|nr:tetratricopeptide repeat protein [Spirochaetaceae bacterium]
DEALDDADFAAMFDNLGDASGGEGGETAIPPDLSVGVSDEEMASLSATLADSPLADAAPDAAPGESPAAGPAPPNEDEKKEEAFQKFNIGAEGAAASDDLPDFDELSAIFPQEAGKKETTEQQPAKEFSIREDDLQTLLETLDAYPLNVRIACEEAIAEETVEPAQLDALAALLVAGARADEAAALLSNILKRTVRAPKAYQTGEELEAEKGSLSYLFVHKFLPFARLALIAAALAASIVYLSYQFIYRPLAAESLYKKGYELILSGEPNNYAQANRHFNDAFEINRVKDWFYKYAERFRDERQYLHAQNKYDELLRVYPHDKKGALDYAGMETNYLRNFEKADRIIRREVLDYAIDDRDALLALGDVNLSWGEVDPSRYEHARASFARALAIHGYSDPVLERMLLYFIRTDQLVEVLPLQQRFMGNPKSAVAPSTLAELGGYLLDKRIEDPQGVPDENIQLIDGIKDILLRAEKADPSLPEPHYHLGRYYAFYRSPVDERITFETAAAAFDAAAIETPKRTDYRIRTQRRLAELMTGRKEYIPAENALQKGINIYEDAVQRRLLTRSREHGRLYADLGDIEYFVKTANMTEATEYYLQAEANGWLPPEVEYRLGGAYYRQEDFPNALRRFFSVSRRIPFNRRLLNTLGAAAYRNSDYFAAESYYSRLLSMLTRDRDRLPIALPDDVPEHRNLLERIMTAQNNLGATMNALARQTGRAAYRSQALTLFAESARTSDSLGRNLQTMQRGGLFDNALSGVSLPYLNIRNTLYPTSDAQDRTYPRIDADVLEPSEWEERID